MDSSINIAVVPMDIVWADKKKNLDRAIGLIQSLRSGTDVVVLPELFTTAFVPDKDLVEDLAETNSGETMSRLAEIAAAKSIAICGTYLGRTSQNFSNRAFFIEPSGEMTFYDKRHLFSLSNEARLLKGGLVLPPLMRFRGWNFSMVVCYDVRFPVWCKNVRMQYDVMLVPANWPESRRYAWEHLLIGRAIENQAYYIGADRSGSDDYGCYDNMAIAVDYYGRKVGEKDAATGIVYVTAVKSGLTEARRRMPVVNDYDDMTIHI